MNGFLVINLEPPYIGFYHSGSSANAAKRNRLRRSTPEEIGVLLRSLGVPLGQNWPCEDYVARIPYRFSQDELARLKLV